jgi:LysM repeat protein
MKNRIAVLSFLLLSYISGTAQTNQLTIEGTPGKFYLVHVVVAKENWYSIGRLFNLSPHEIASFNNLSFDKPLDISQLLHIPLLAGNFDQKQIKSTGETLVPIYHVVDEKEWMYKISSTFNDVPVSSLEKWNRIKRDDVKKGMPLIVGFLKVKTDLSPLAQGIASNPAVAVTDVSNKTVKQTDIPTTGANKPVSPSAGTAPVIKPGVTTASNTGAVTTTAIPASNPPERVNNYAATHSNGGFFSIDYAGIGKSASGLAGTFKSTSGWSDGKYYALMNAISVGTIIRVTATNGKTIFAKVLGQLPEMKESAGLLIRISNAASAELGLGEGKFPVEVKY